ncbi:alpha/beta hydrolase [Panacibacter ginsenosidivorans]|uniref:Alpha/beta hydrolase n=1 Tax=Panacibacter ginsenosidivorans TaxID=1813871 RepID=A0A5B8V9Z6_9BACT|nr:alpha/beta hydrolase [Panacibacter ginsenosidivorans]QEC68340.1 alpha/beta hydrolase [Panacibacter ginsenosidivorans]
MKSNAIACLSLLSFFITTYTNAQTTSPVQHIFPKETVTYSNIPYADDTLTKHTLDVYLPAKAKNNLPLVVWIHGGAWMLNDKYADMSYMQNTVRGFIDSGYALASINYRYSTDAVFPAQIQDCNKALEFLYQHAAQYHIDNSRIAVIGFSAGGHLASLMALSNNNDVKDFYPPGLKTHFHIKALLDFYGPSDFIAIASNPDTSVNNARNPVSILLGAQPVNRPDLAKHASPVTYVDKNDPPALIVQGEKDESVPNTQSRLLSSWLTIAGVKNQLIIVPNAPHYGVMFDTENIRRNVFAFLATYLRQ